MTLQQLNKDFGIASVLEFISGAGELPMIKIETPLATALVSLYGAQVLSFQPKEAAHDILFLSKKAHYQQGKAIRGGVPICWPWFSGEKPSPHLPNHGFARISTWKIAKTSYKNSFAQLQLVLEDSAETREMWDHAFKLTLDITIDKQLSLNLTTENTGTKTFQFSQAMHTYFSVGDINAIQITGLEGRRYVDTVDGKNSVHQQGDAIQIQAETDRIYTGVSGKVALDDTVNERKVRIQSSGSKTTVVWNPWQDISLEMEDLNDDDYQRFICIETVNTGEDMMTLAPAKSHTMNASYTLISNKTEK